MIEGVNLDEHRGVNLGEHPRHRNGRFRGRSIRMWPLYETAVPEWVADVEKAVIRWGLGSKRPFHCENEKGGGGGLEGGHGAYWVYLVLAQPE